MVNAWKEAKHIEGVADDDSNIVNPIITYIEEWMLVIKIFGEKRRVSEIFLTIVTKQGFGTLIKNYVEIL